MKFAEALRWARANGWRPRCPRNRRNGGFLWEHEDGRLRVNVDICGDVDVRQRIPAGWVTIMHTKTGSWQQVLNALTVHGILPPQFNTAYLAAVEPVEWQWGVRIIHSDGSSGIDWMTEDTARSELMYAAEVDFQPHMRVQTRQLVRRRVIPRPVQVVESKYEEWRAAAAERSLYHRKAEDRPAM